MSTRDPHSHADILESVAARFEDEAGPVPDDYAERLRYNADLMVIYRSLFRQAVESLREVGGAR